MRILVTGWAGFIGSNLTRMLIDRTGPDDEFCLLDAHTYASRPQWALDMIGNSDPRFKFHSINLADPKAVEFSLNEFKPDQVYHLAAESHVCNSITGPRAFAETNFMGTFNLLEALRKNEFTGRMVHVSTDETFGALDYKDDPFTERTPLDPRSPYSASKAASDLMVSAYVHTYGLDAVITRCSNNYGPNQHEEKLIPKTIKAFLNNEDVMIYGSGNHVRDWIFVDQHCEGLINAMENGKDGEVYCLGSGIELSNKEVILSIYEVMTSMGLNPNYKTKHIDARPTDDRRYALDTFKAQSDIGFTPNGTYSYFRYQIEKTVRWYMENKR